MMTAFVNEKKVYAAGLKAAVSDSLAVPVGSTSMINITIGTGEDANNQQQIATTLQILLLVSLIAVAPSILLMMTCFPRFLISLHFIRNALGTQQMPPNQILVSIALFLSLFLMRDQLNEINTNALQPFARSEITQEIAIDRALSPLRDFMFSQAEKNDVELFAKMAGYEIQYDSTNLVVNQDDVPSTVLIPAFMIGELTKGFKIGVIIYIPFIVIDMVVASTLMAMGMMMLPPAMISLPFKLILFVMVDGWSFTIGHIYQTFRK